MNLCAVGCSYRATHLSLREQLAFKPDQLTDVLHVITRRWGCEAAILSTCNRIELYLGHRDAHVELNRQLVAEFLADYHQVPDEALKGHFYEYRQHAAVRHLFRVAAGLDSLILGESQIAGQVKRAYELARELGSVGPVLHSLFQSATVVARRVRKETGIAGGNVSVASAAIEYVRQVFDSFADKSVFIIGAGKMAGLMLKQLGDLQPGNIWITNRNPEKAAAMTSRRRGSAVPWELLDEFLTRADIVLSTTGASEPIVTQERYQRIRKRRAGRPLVVLDIAVPRDFDPRIHDGDQVFIFNIDDFNCLRERTLHDRRGHVRAAEAIIGVEELRFAKRWRGRQHASLIGHLRRKFEAKRETIVQQLFKRLQGRLQSEDQEAIAGAFHLLQNQLLHLPIAALAEELPDDEKHTLPDALTKLFRLPEEVDELTAAAPNAELDREHEEQHPESVSQLAHAVESLIDCGTKSRRVSPR